MSRHFARPGAEVPPSVSRSPLCVERGRLLSFRRNSLKLGDDSFPRGRICSSQMSIDYRHLLMRIGLRHESKSLSAAVSSEF
jgi:hypothetical protein